MLERTPSFPSDKPSLSHHIEAGEAASSQDVASCRRVRFLWTGFGFAVLMLIGVPACFLFLFASHASEASSSVAMVAFSPSMPLLGSGGIQPAIAGLRPVVPAEANRQHPFPGPHMTEVGPGRSQPWQLPEPGPEYEVGPGGGQRAVVPDGESAKLYRPETFPAPVYQTTDPEAPNYVDPNLPTIPGVGTFIVMAPVLILSIGVIADALRNGFVNPWDPQTAAALQEALEAVGQ